MRVVFAALALALVLMPTVATAQGSVDDGLPCSTEPLESGTFRATCVFGGATPGPISVQAVLEAVNGTDSSSIFIAANGGEGGTGYDSGATPGNGGLQGYAASYFDNYDSYLSKFGDELYVWLGAAGRSTSYDTGSGTGGSGGSSTVVLTGSGSRPVACMLAQPAEQYPGNGSFPIGAFSNSGSSCTEQNVLLIAGGGGGGGCGCGETGGGGGDGGVALGGYTSALVSSVGAGGKGADGHESEGTGGGPGSFSAPGSPGSAALNLGAAGTEGLGGFGGGAGTDPTGFEPGPGSFVGAPTVGAGGSSNVAKAFGSPGGGGGGFGGGGSGGELEADGGGGGGGSFAAVGDRMVMDPVGERLGGGGSLIIVINDVRTEGLPCTIDAFESDAFRATCVFGGAITSPISVQAILENVKGTSSSSILIAANGGEGGTGVAAMGNPAGGGLQGYAATYFDDYDSYISKFGDGLYVWLGAAGLSPDETGGRSGGGGGSSTVVLTGSGSGSVPVACMLAQPAEQFPGGASFAINASSNSGSSCSEQNVLLIAGGGGGSACACEPGSGGGGGGGDGGVALGGYTSAVVSSVGAGGKGADGHGTEGTGGGPGSFSAPGSPGSGAENLGTPGTEGLGGFGGGAGTDPTGFKPGPGSYVGAPTVGAGGSSNVDQASGRPGGGGGGFGGGGSGGQAGGDGGGGGGGSFAAVGNRMVMDAVGERLGGDGSLIIVVNNVEPPAVDPDGPELPATGSNATTTMVVAATLFLGVGIMLLGQRRTT